MPVVPPAPSKAQQQLYSFLQKKRTLDGIDFATQDVVSLFHYFNISGLNYKGQLSSAYGQVGAAVSGSIDINLLNFISVLLPGLSVAVSPGFQLQILKEDMLVCQVFPEYIYSNNVNLQKQISGVTPQYHYTSQNGTPAVPLLHSAKNIGLFSYVGTSGKGKFTLSVAAGASLPLPSLGDALGLDLSVTLQAGAGITGKFIRLKSLAPKPFPRPSDATLLAESQLEFAVNQILNQPTKANIKEEVDAWIASMTEAYLTSMLPPKSSVGGITTRLKTKVPFSRVSEAVEGILNANVFPLIKVEFRVPAFHTWLDNWSKSKTSGSLRRRLYNLRNQITNPQLSIDNGARSSAIKQIDIYIDLLYRFNQKINPEYPISDYRSLLSYFRLFSFGASANVGASANFEASAQLLLPSDQSVGASASASAMAGASAKAKYITYRYQAINDNGQAPVVYTQDTCVNFRQTKLTAEALAELGIPAYEYEAGVGKQKVYQSISYKAVGLYWVHGLRRIFDAQNGSYFTNPCNGSGVSYGMSVSMKRLINYARMKVGMGALDSRVTASQNTRLKSTITKQLRLPPESFDAFITGAEIHTYDPSQFPSYIFLESSHAYIQPPRINLIRKAFTASDPATGDFVPGSNYYYDPDGSFGNTNLARPLLPPSRNASLSAIRLRYRYSDAHKDKNPLFQLGFHVLDTGFNFDVTQIEKAGQNAFIELYTHWFNNPDYNTVPYLAEPAQELSMQPVVMLHL